MVNSEHLSETLHQLCPGRICKSSFMPLGLTEDTDFRRTVFLIRRGITFKEIYFLLREEL